MKVGLGLYLFFLLSQLAVVVEAIDSWHHNIFLPRQMFANYWRAGINFITHGGMWLDMFLLPPLLCYMLAHSAGLSFRHDWPFALLGIILTGANHGMLINNERPDPLGCTQLKWSLAIGVHAVYMAVYIAIIGHFYFYSMGVSPLGIAVVSVLLGIHVAAGTHVFLGMANLIWNWTWCPDLLGDKALPIMNGAVWVLLAGLSGYGGGSRAAAAVLFSGILFGCMVAAFVLSVRKAKQLRLFR